MTDIAPPFFCLPPSLMSHNSKLEDARPLAGVRVVSVAQNVPGPLTVARLVEKGASAVKVEPTSGDPFLGLSRSWYDEMHRDVSVERLDLKGEGRARIGALLADADLNAEATARQIARSPLFAPASPK